MASKAKFQKGLCYCGPLSLLMLDYMFFIDLQLAQRDQTDPGLWFRHSAENFSYSTDLILFQLCKLDTLPSVVDEEAECLEKSCLP